MIQEVFYGKVLDNVAAGSDHYSNPIPETSSASLGSAQIIWSGLTGTLNAAMVVEVCNDGGTKWDPISGASMVLSSAEGHDTISLNGVLSEQKIRLAYAHNGCNGGLVSAHVELKG